MTFQNSVTCYLQEAFLKHKDIFKFKSKILATFISYGSLLVSIEIGVKQNIVRDKQNHMLTEGLVHMSLYQYLTSTVNNDLQAQEANTDRVRMIIENFTAIIEYFRLAISITIE